MACIPVLHSIILTNGFSPQASWEVDVNLYGFGFFFFYSLPLNIIKPSCALTSVAQMAGTVMTYLSSR